ncbi:MAG: DUF2029 domain-containing protein [Anaerolineae bacterium]|nr:DUF2029 domain-containing protein [Anaerolineae bacterium]
MSQEQKTPPAQGSEQDQQDNEQRVAQTGSGSGQGKTRPMAPYDAPESGGPLPEVDDAPLARPVDDIQGALVEAARHGEPTEVDFDELPEPVPDVDEGPRPGPVDDIQEALFTAGQQGAPADVEFDRLPEPAVSFPQKIIRFAINAVSTEVTAGSAESTSPETKKEIPFAPPAPASSAIGSDFWLLLALFLTFRLLTLFLLKPGGFIRDWSDFDTYYGIAGLTDYGLYPFLHFWLEWPPLMPWLMVGVYKLSLLLPPWPDDPRLWFVLILGAVFVLFEVGNFVLIYRLARRLFPSADTLKRVLWLYAGLFPPVYAMLGFFDGAALFFMLLTLDLLLSERRLLSAISAGVGFMVKIIPVVMLPVALRRLWYQYQGNKREASIEIGLYSVVFGLTILLLFSPFLIAGPEWVLASLRSILGRSSWETVWAVMDGYYGFGLVNGDRLNPAETNFAVHNGTLPWSIWWLITLVFAGIYAFLFTRPADYSQPRNVLAFSGLTVAIFILYNKGYSPQFLVYLLPFILLMFPDGRGVVYAFVLTGLNILEQPIYFVMLPQTTWLLTFIVVTRFMVLLVLAVEFALMIWSMVPRLAFLLKPRQYAPLVLGSLSLLALLGLTPLMLRAYADNRLTNSPVETFAGFMNAQAQNIGSLASCLAGPDSQRLYLSDQATYRELYPYLHHNFDLQLVVGAPDAGDFPPLSELLPDSGTAWILPTGPQGQVLSSRAAKKGRSVETYYFEELGQVSLYRFPANSNLTCLTLARFTGGIELLTYQLEVESGAVNVTLFWRARNPQTQDLKVFTHLLDANGQWIVGDDSVPRRGTAPTTTWPVDAVQIDPHRIELPPGLPPGNYTLTTGLYNDFGGRLPAFAPNGLSYPNQSAPLETISLP